MAYNVFVHYNGIGNVYPRTKNDLVIHVVRQQHREVLIEISMKELLDCIALSKLFSHKSLMHRSVYPTFSIYGVSLHEVLSQIGQVNIANQEILEPLGVVKVLTRRLTDIDLELEGIDVLIVSESSEKTRIYGKLSHQLSRLLSLIRDEDVRWQITTTPFVAIVSQPLDSVIQNVLFLTGITPVFE